MSLSIPNGRENGERRSEDLVAWVVGGRVEPYYDDRKGVGWQLAPDSPIAPVLKAVRVRSRAGSTFLFLSSSPVHVCMYIVHRVGMEPETIPST